MKPKIFAVLGADRVGKSTFIENSFHTIKQFNSKVEKLHFSGPKPSHNNPIDQYALKLSITDTSSGAGSKPLEVAVDGSSKLSLSKAGDLTVAGKVNLPSQPPANAGSAGVVGDVAWDSGFIYICVANNTWKRAAISTWV